MCDEPGVYNGGDLRDLESNLEDDIALIRHIRDKAAKKKSSWQCILNLGDGFTRTIELKEFQYRLSVPIARGIIAKMDLTSEERISAEYCIIEFESIGANYETRIAFYERVR